MRQCNFCYDFFFLRQACIAIASYCEPDFSCHCSLFLLSLLEQLVCPLVLSLMSNYVYYNCILSQRECQFEQALKSATGMIIKKMRPDGACLFRAVGELVPYIL